MGTAHFVRRHALDGVVIALALVIQLEIWLMPLPGPKAALVPGMLLATLPLLLRRRFPFASAACIFGALAGLTFVDREAPASTGWILFALFIAFWIAGAHEELRQAAAGLLTGLAAMVVVVERDAGVYYDETSGLFAIGCAAWLAARILRRWRRRGTELETRLLHFEKGRDEQEQAALAGERRRIARELHDVIAHSVSVMIVQAGAARMLVAEAPERAREALVSVEETGRQALAEMRRLLGVLREQGPAVGLAPQPSLAELDALLEQARRAEVDVELANEGITRPLPAGVDLAAYRIVQEALTNARKHAGKARVQVTVRHAPDALELEIADDGRAAGGSAPGHGLVGMRERVALYGGELEAGPRAGGGYRVLARLPLDGDPDVTPDERGEPSSRVRPSSLFARHWFDALIVLLAVVTEVEVWAFSVPGPKLVTAPAALLVTLPLLLRHRFPFAAPVFTFLVQVGVTFIGDEVGAIETWFVAMLAAFGVLGARNPRSHAVAGLAIGIASLAVAAERDARVPAAEAGNAVIIAVAVWLAAVVFRRHAERNAQLEERAAGLEREQEERERAVVADERKRIARELHDVIAHCVSVMTVQAGAARLTLAKQPGRASVPLLAVEETGRQALAELRRLLEILRRDMVETALTPQPGLADLRALVERCAGAGLRVELTVEGEPEQLAPGLDLTAYRVVQEALTNAIKHAGPARATVAVRYDAGTLDLAIVDDGKAAPPSDGHGHGLVGMRERVALYGGELDAGPRPDGGFAVHARLPRAAPS